MGLTTLDFAALESVLKAPDGPVVAHATVVAEAIKAVAADLIHTSDGAHEDGSPHLRDTGEVRIEAGTVVVAFIAGYAAAYHEGSRPHEIVPRNASVLAFPWAKKGPGVFFFPRVNHPGYAGNPFLRHAAETVAASPLA